MKPIILYKTTVAPHLMMKMVKIMKPPRKNQLKLQKKEVLVKSKNKQNNSSEINVKIIIYLN